MGPYIPNLTDFGLLTDQAGELVLGEHGATIQVATDAYTGKRWQKVCERTPGLTQAARTAEVQRLRNSGAVHIASPAPGVAGWWELVNEQQPAAIAPPAAPAQPAAAQ